MKLLNDFIFAATETGKYLRSVNYNERDEQGKPIYKIRDVMASLKDCEGMINSLEKLEDKVKKEKSTSNTLRGKGEKGLFED